MADWCLKILDKRYRHMDPGTRIEMARQIASGNAHMIPVSQVFMKHIDAGSRVVDLGCGDGRLLERLRREMQCSRPPARAGSSKTVHFATSRNIYSSNMQTPGLLTALI